MRNRFEREEYIAKLQEKLSQVIKEIESKDARIESLISEKESCLVRLDTLKDDIDELQNRPHQYFTLNGRTLSPPEGYIQRREYVRYIRIF